MALIVCPECGNKVSTEAKACPSCGYPIAENSGEPHSAAAARSAAELMAQEETVLLEVRTSWWHYGWHLLFFWLVIPPLIALYRRHSFVMRIYGDQVGVEEGLWSRESRQFFIKDIRAIDIDQGFWSRLVNIGDMTISTAATADATELAVGIPNPHGIKEMLIAERRQSTT